MLGRSSRSALSNKPTVQAGAAVIGKTAETVAELAERAAAAAREAQRAATPALRGAAQTSAESLSHAAERAAEVLADAAQRLAQAVPAPESAAPEIAEVATGPTPAAPGRWLRRLRRLLVAAGVAGGAYVAVTRTPLKAKLTEMIFGPPLDEDEPEPITLPVSGSPVDAQESAGSADGDAPSGEAPETPPSTRGRGRTRGAGASDQSADA